MVDLSLVVQFGIGIHKMHVFGSLKSDHQTSKFNSCQIFSYIMVITDNLGALFKASSYRMMSPTFSEHVQQTLNDG